MLDRITEDSDIKSQILQKYKQTVSSAFIFVNSKLARDLDNPTLGMNLGYEISKKAIKLQKAKKILRGSDIDILVKRIEETKDYRFQTFIKIVPGTALRRGEIMALEWKNIRFDDNYIEIYKTMVKHRGTWILTDYTQNKTHRIVPLFPSIKKCY